MPPLSAASGPRPDSPSTADSGRARSSARRANGVRRDVPAREARAVALERSAGAPIDDALGPLVELRDAGEILRLADGSGTTREHRARERTTIRIAERVSDHRITSLDRDSVVAQVDRLDRELHGRGGRLSDEQRQAIMLACSDRQLVMIEGQAGTGKSTALTGIARAHHHAGRDIVVTSTAGVAAERLARDLHHAGVDTVTRAGRGPVNEPSRPIAQPHDDDHPSARDCTATNEESAFDRENEPDTQHAMAERDPAAAHEGGIDPDTPSHADQDTRRRGWPRRPGIEPGRPQREPIRDNAEVIHAPGSEP